MAELVPLLEEHKQDLKALSVNVKVSNDRFMYNLFY